MIDAGRRAGYDRRLSVREVEVSYTQVFAEPARLPALFDAAQLTQAT